jgi:hypothetical protein
MRESESYAGPAQSSAIELIVEGYARLKDRQSLEDLRMHRRQLAVDLEATTDLNCRSSIAQIEQDIAAIEAGLRCLSAPVAG